MNDAICALILLPHLQVENANAVSGPLSWGFPPPTAFIGFAHALQRHLGNVALGGVGIVCHRFDPQVYLPNSYSPFRFRLARHPYIAGWKKFEDEAAAIIEEGRAHLEVSLVIAVLDELDEDKRQDLARRIQDVLPVMRLAGGAIRRYGEIQVRCWPQFAKDQREKFRKLRYRFLPGFTLVRRDDLLAERLTKLRQEDPAAGALDAFLDLLAMHVEPVQEEEEMRWQIRSRPGWLVPLPVGYAALSPLYEPGQVSGARDLETPFRFVESLYTIGQWLGPHRLTQLEQMLWYPDTDHENGLYLCRNDCEQLTLKEHCDDKD